MSISHAAMRRSERAAEYERKSTQVRDMAAQGMAPKQIAQQVQISKREIALILAQGASQPA